MLLPSDKSQNRASLNKCRSRYEQLRSLLFAADDKIFEQQIKQNEMNQNTRYKLVNGLNSIDEQQEKV